MFLPLCLGYIFVCQFDRIIQSFTHFVCLSPLVRVLMPVLYSLIFIFPVSASSLRLMFNCSGVLRLRNMRSQRTLHDLPLALALASINQKGNGIMHQHLHRTRSRSRTQPSAERVELSASLTSALTSSLFPPPSLLCQTIRTTVNSARPLTNDIKANGPDLLPYSSPCSCSSPR